MKSAYEVKTVGGKKCNNYTIFYCPKKCDLKHIAAVEPDCKQL